MSAVTLIIIALICYFFGYRFYSGYLARKIFELKNDKPTPAQKLNDNKDYVPTKKWVLWGHHFASIAGAAPIVGPAVAIIWGWVPALCWVVFGTIFMGAVHDFGTLVLSMKRDGKSLATLSGELISPRVRRLFLVVVLFLVWMVIAVFALVIANLFVSFPSSVLPVNFQILVALAIGLFFHRQGKKLMIPTVVAQILLFVTIYLGSFFPIELNSLTDSPLMLWIYFLLMYSFLASILPVWILLQPRDFINSHQLLIGLGMIILGVFITQPQVVAPAFQPNPKGAPPWFPFLFITIACGAISGFHGLVSAGTTSKQVEKWTDTRSIGYGGMIAEGCLALLATLAVSAGFADSQAWHSHYASWNTAKGLSASINAFVFGSSQLLSGLGLSSQFSQTMMAVFIVSFAATSLDTAARIQRYIIGEIGENTKIKALQSPWVGALVAIGSALFLMLAQEEGKGGLLLWPLFGSANQMLAALSLMVIATYLLRKKKNPKPYWIPFALIFTITLIGLGLNTMTFFKNNQFLLSFLSGSLLAIELWIAFEVWILLRTKPTEKS